MISSAFNKFITIKKEVSVKNAIGTPVPTPVEANGFLKETWANFRVLGGNTQFTEVGALPNSDVEFTIRYDPEIDYSCTILFDNQLYKILHFYTENRKDFTKIRCKVWEAENNNG